MITVGIGDRLIVNPDRRRDRETYDTGQHFAFSLQSAFEGTGLTISTTSAAGVAGQWSSRITHVQLGDPITASVLLRDGLLVEDLQAVSDRLAESLSAEWCDVARVRAGLVKVVAGYSPRPDPLAAMVGCPSPVSSVHSPVLFGKLESGEMLARSLVDMHHVLFQGQTQSGKSTGAYSLLSQLTKARDVIVGGCDASGLLLRPWAKRRDQHASWQALGLSSITAHVQVLERAVKLMDSRLARLPDGEDHIAITEKDPLFVLVLEEWAGILRSADKNQRAELLSHYGRLVSEGSKVGFRVVMLIQRADAELTDGYSRAQFVTRVSFATDVDGLKMLHNGADIDLLRTHQTALPGIALLTHRGMPLSRLKSPYTTSQSYWQSVIPGDTPETLQGHSGASKVPSLASVA